MDEITTITLGELNDIKDKIINSEGGEGYAIVDGKEYRSDMAYAIEGIEIFFDVMYRYLNGLIELK